ncbi:MAG TPA: dihydrofolate reductase family protein [Allosphingosinicella sp.]|jgi:dihydrofolate reductase
MRRVIYGGAVSADLYLAGPGEVMDWLRWDEEVAAISAASWTGVDTMLIGRKTYDFAIRNHGGIPSQPGIRSILFSRSLAEAPPGVDLVREDAVDFVRSLKAERGGDIIVMGGGQLGSALLAAGLVDEIGLNLHPLLLGGGTPAFQPMPERLELEPLETRALANGCALMRWRVVN